MNRSEYSVLELRTTEHTWISTEFLRKEKTYQEHVASSLDLLNIVRLGQFEVALGVKTPNVGEKFGAVVLTKLCSKRVDGNVQRAAIRLKLTVAKTAQGVPVSKNQCGVGLQRIVDKTKELTLT